MFEELCTAQRLFGEKEFFTNFSGVYGKDPNPTPTPTPWFFDGGAREAARRATFRVDKGQVLNDVLQSTFAASQLPFWRIGLYASAPGQLGALDAVVFVLRNARNLPELIGSHDAYPFKHVHLVKQLRSGLRRAVFEFYGPCNGADGPDDIVEIAAREIRRTVLGQIEDTPAQPWCARLEQMWLTSRTRARVYADATDQPAVEVLQRLAKEATGMHTTEELEAARTAARADMHAMQDELKQTLASAQQTVAAQKEHATTLRQELAAARAAAALPDERGVRQLQRDLRAARARVCRGERDVQTVRAEMGQQQTKLEAAQDSLTRTQGALATLEAEGGLPALSCSASTALTTPVLADTPQRDVGPLLDILTDLFDSAQVQGFGRQRWGTRRGCRRRALPLPLRAPAADTAVAGVRCERSRRHGAAQGGTDAA